MRAFLCLLLARTVFAACSSDEMCPKATPICVEIDRHGEVGYGKPGKRSLCVAPAKNGACGPDFRLDKKGYFSQTQGIVDKQVCVPLPKYGAGKLDDPCKEDDECEKESPYCVGGHCTLSCKLECPAKFECVMFQLIKENHIAQENFCAPILPSPPLAQTPFCKGMPGSAQRLLAKEGQKSIAAWKRIEACALPAGDPCAAASMAPRILNQMSGRILVRWIEECRARPKDDQACEPPSAQLLRPACREPRN